MISHLRKCSYMQLPMMNIVSSGWRSPCFICLFFSSVLFNICGQRRMVSVQTESGAGQSIFQCRRKSSQLTPRSRERHKVMRTGTGKSWMGQTEDSLLQVCQLTELKQTKEQERDPNRFRRLYKTLLPESMGKHCREWPAGKRE